MTYLLIILSIILILSHIFLSRMIRRMVKYQNFKANVLLRLAFAKDFEEMKESDTAFSAAELDEVEWKDMHMRRQQEAVERIKKMISAAVDEELDNDANWQDVLVAIRAERFFVVDNSYPFYQIFDQTIITRFHERNTRNTGK